MRIGRRTGVVLAAAALTMSFGGTIVPIMFMSGMVLPNVGQGNRNTEIGDHP